MFYFCHTVHSFLVIPAKQAVLQLTKLHMLFSCHSGLDPWFDRLTVLSDVEGLTTLSKVEGETSAFSAQYATGCRIKSGMKGKMPRMHSYI